MKKRWLTMLTTMFALTFTLGLAACGGCDSCNTSGSESSSEVQSSSIAGSIAESSEEEMSSSEAEESSEFTTSPMFSSLEDVESSETEESTEIVESSEEDSFVEEESSSEEENKEKTDEEIFAEIKAAVLATQSYNGAFSMNFRQENLAVGDEGYEAGYFTYNPETLEHALVGSDEMNATREKVFKKDGKYYMYYANGMETELEKSQICEEMSWPNVLEYQTTYINYYSPWAFLESYGTLAIADTYAELLEAFAIVRADTLADMEAEGYGNVQSSIVVDLGMEGSKSWISFTLAGSCVGDPDDASSEYQGQRMFKFFVEDGYVVSVEGTYYIYSNGEWGVDVSDFNAVYAYTYAFDQELFDSVIPCESQAKTEYEMCVNLHYHPNYITQVSRTITAEKTKEDILASLNTSLIYSAPEDLNLEIDCWYLDEACTVKFDPDAITDLMEYERITDLYAKSVSFDSKYAWVIRAYSYENHCSKPYQIVAMFFGYGRHSDIMREPFCLAGELYDLPIADKVLVDGVETTAESITLEGGKTYVVTRVDYAQDSDYWLFP